MAASNLNNRKSKANVVVLAVLLILSLLALLIGGVSSRKEKKKLVAERDTAVSQLTQLRVQYDALLDQLRALELKNDSLSRKAEFDRSLIMSLKRKIQQCLANGSGPNGPKELREARGGR